jgi:hypothetical protein
LQMTNRRGVHHRSGLAAALPTVANNAAAAKTFRIMEQWFLFSEPYHFLHVVHPVTRARRTDRTRISFQAEPIAELKCWRVGSWSGTRHMIKWALSLALLLAINTTAAAGGKAALASRYSETRGMTASGETYSPTTLTAAHRTCPSAH